MIGNSITICGSWGVEMGTQQMLEWADVSGVAENAFQVWVDGSELQWAEKAWQLLTDAGLTTYESEIQRCRVVMRFLALSGIYKDFCDVAWDELSGASEHYAELASELEITSFRAGQLVGEKFDDSSLGDDYELFESAVTEFADAARDEVFPVLKNGFGGTAGLFVSLWRTNSPPPSQRTLFEEDEDEDSYGDFETVEEILDDATFEKAHAYSWLEEGCPPYR